jgi:hypothetical protein
LRIIVTEIAASATFFDGFAMNDGQTATAQSYLAHRGPRPLLTEIRKKLKFVCNK